MQLYEHFANHEGQHDGHTQNQQTPRHEYLQTLPLADFRPTMAELSRQRP
jgi:hypothetical protein